MSRKIVIISILMMLLCLTACTKKFEEEDVKKYIRDDMHISSFKILSGPVDVKGEDGYTDQEWTVSTDVFDLGEDLVFHVYNDVYYSMEWTTNRLDDDLLYQKQLVLYKEAMKQSLEQEVSECLICSVALNKIIKVC